MADAARPHDGRVAVVTGGAEGLGSAYAQRLARDGAHVVVADVQDAARTVGLVEAAGGSAVAVRCDVSAEADVAALLEATLERSGRCDILVNNAGISPNQAWADLDLAAWRRVMAVNLDAMFLTCRAFTPGMASRGWGRVVNISSNTTGLVIAGFTHYIASKAGVIGLTRGLATELGNSGVTVNAVLPGLTRTASTDAQWEGTSLFADMAARQAIGRPGVPEDLDGVVSFLARDDARWVTGQSFSVDGGLVRL